MDAATATAPTPTPAKTPTQTAPGVKSNAVGWSVRFSTARTSVKDKLTGLKAGPDTTRPVAGKPGEFETVKEADQTQIPLAVNVILDRVNALPQEYDGVLVVASGTQELEAGRSSMVIQVYGRKGHL